MIGLYKIKSNFEVCRGVVSLLHGEIISKYFPNGDYHQRVSEFFTITDRDLLRLYNMNYPFYGCRVFDSNIDRLTTELPEFIASIIYIGYPALRALNEGNFEIDFDNLELSFSNLRNISAFNLFVWNMFEGEDHDDFSGLTSSYFLHLYNKLIIRKPHYDIVGCIQYHLLRFWNDERVKKIFKTEEQPKIIPLIDAKKNYLINEICRPTENNQYDEFWYVKESNSYLLELGNSLKDLRETKNKYEEEKNIEGLKLVDNLISRRKQIKSEFPELFIKYGENKISEPYIDSSKKENKLSELQLDKPELNKHDNYNQKLNVIRTKIAPIKNILSDTSVKEWKEVSILRVSKDSILIKAGSFSNKYTYTELGLKDHRKGDMPNRIWLLLMVLAKTNGHIPYEKLTLDLRKKIEKSISDLRRLLKSLTGLSADPIHRFSKKRGYLTKFVIRDERPGKNQFTEDDLI